jgi:hypothetical protein
VICPAITMTLMDADALAARLNHNPRKKTLIFPRGTLPKFNSDDSEASSSSSEVSGGQMSARHFSLKISRDHNQTKRKIQALEASFRDGLYAPARRLSRANDVALRKQLRRRGADYDAWRAVGGPAYR